MLQEVNLCDSLAVAPVNRNVLAQTQSHLTSENENGGQQVSTTNPSFNNNGNYNEQDKNVCTGQMDEDQDEVMKEEEDYSEESLIRCQSPDAPMTDSSYSETGSLLETPYGLSPGTSPEPASPVALMEGSEEPSQSSTLYSCYGDTKTEVVSEKSVFSLGQITSSQETVLNHKQPSVIEPSDVSLEEKELLHQSVSFTGKETSNEPSTTEISMSQEPSQLLGFLDQLAKRGDDTHLPQYLHQIAEAFYSHEDYQRAVWCLQLEQLYHQRLLDNLNALQKQWETRCDKTSPALTAQHLDTLKHICQTHSRPNVSDAVCASRDPSVVPSCSLAKGRMEQVKREDPTGSFSLSASIDQGNKMDSSEVTEGEWEECKSGKTIGLCPDQSNEKEGSEREVDETESVLGGTMLAKGDVAPPSVTDDMDQSKTAEQQGGGLRPAQEKETDPEEERDVEEATEALDMEDEEEAEDEEHNGKAFTFCPKTLPVETVVSSTAVEIRQLESKSEQEESQLIPGDKQSTGEILPSEMHTPEECMYPSSLEDLEKEEEEDYDLEPADLIRAAATLDTLAKLITVEEMVPAPGLVSILKKRTVCSESPTPASPEPQFSKMPAKRRVRFKVPDDGFDSDMGGGDSCLLLFLLCLVTVVISIGGTALYCALGDTHSSVCQDFSRNADFYISQVQRGISQIQHWLTPAS